MQLLQQIISKSMLKTTGKYDLLNGNLVPIFPLCVAIFLFKKRKEEKGFFQ